MRIRSDRTYRFDRSPSEVWEAIGRVDQYQGWWPWLRRFDAEALAPGERWRCTIRPPVPYVLRITVDLDEVEPPRSISATVSGDIRGEAAVSLEETDSGCEVRLVSSLATDGQPLRSLTRWAPWLATFGHDWVLDTGLRQFRRRAL